MWGKKRRGSAPDTVPDATLLVFDTETTGLPRDFRASYKDTKNWPRLVSIAWAFMDGLGNQTGSRAYIVKPEGFVIPDDAVRVHGITTERAMQVGVPLAYALQDFAQCLDWAQVVIAHNMDFDQAITQCEAVRLGMDLPFGDTACFCTMKSMTDVCCIPFADGRGNKWPTLAEAHAYCCGEPHQRAHDACCDVDAVVHIVQYLLREGMLRIGRDDA
jgi:DNA polymerase III epsilon subunit-like protein